MWPPYQAAYVWENKFELKRSKFKVIVNENVKIIFFANIFV